MLQEKEMTVKQTRGTVGERKTLSRTNDEEIAFVNALKALDDVKMEQVYLSALRDIAETVLDVEFDDNNEVKPSNTNVQ